MHPLDNALRCLKHPATIASIGLLLVNDHILKIIAPSWLTGKLSDFAGLFFFPFVLAALLSPFTRRAGVLAFWITGAWFALIKTSAWGIAATQDLLFPLFGYRIPIVLDPSDLIALIVLIPAWRLWKRATVTSRPTVRAWMLLGVASLAALATSPAPYDTVERVAAVGNTAYVRTNRGIGSGGDIHLAMSEDGGKTWKETRNASVEFAQAATLPRVVCESNKPDVCYRITEKYQVEESRDSGNTWSIAWKIPEGRREYAERLWRTNIPPFALYPYDLALVKPVGVNGLSTLIVAMGTQGILVRTPEGNWNRYGVLLATPTPFYGNWLLDPLFVCSGELFAVFFAAGLAFLLLLIVIAIVQKLRRKLDGGTTFRSLLTAGAIAPVSFLPMVLWCTGAIQMYQTALICAYIAGLATFGFAVVQVLWMKK